jgi:hypothetical protein
MTPDDVAHWMLTEVKRDGTVYQDVMASAMEDKFGEEFVPSNINGHPSIRPDVLKIFGKISKESVVWVKSDKAWRLREPHDEPGRQQP